MWFVSDSWLVGDVIHYLRHLRVLAAEGITIRFLLVTPLGWTEVPCGQEWMTRSTSTGRRRVPKSGTKARPKNNNKKEEG